MSNTVLQVIALPLSIGYNMKHVPYTANQTIENQS